MRSSADSSSVAPPSLVAPQPLAKVGTGPRRDSILQPGRNCWRIERADQVAFLIDGEAFFGAVRSALAKARRSIFILGWDIDSRMRLTSGAPPDGLPAALGEFLNSIVANRPRLRGYVLSWDFAMLYAMEREWLPIYKLDWKTHRRLSFRLDDRHPPGASHHQKVIVVDDAVAFVSGYDLTRARWDTSAHARDDPRRVDHRGEAYAPFHDVGIVVSGDCARALGELARERWRRATDHLARTKPGIAAEVWPDLVDADAIHVPVAIARTEPSFDGRAAVGEIRTLFLDAIASARRHIFAESQYFTSRAVADALARRLGDDNAPEIAVLSPHRQSGWLEASTMGVLRARIHRDLRAADRFDRYRLYSPTLPEQTRDTCLNVHSKVMTIDDDLVVVGSANLADRSLGMDTECNLAFEARGDVRLRRAIAGLRERLLAEHLDCRPAEVAATMRREGSLHRAVERLARPSGRTLCRAELALDPTLDAFVPDHGVIDPEQPIRADAIVADLVPHEDTRAETRGGLIGFGLALLTLGLLALAWHFTSLHDWLAVDRLLDWGDELRGHPWSPLGVAAVFVAGGLIAFPLLVLIALTAAVFGPALGALYAAAGAMLSATATFGIGRKLGRETVRKLAGNRINALSRRLAQHGLLAVLVVRMLPIAPFSIVNVVAGASHIRWRDFLFGTFLGLMPGIAAMTLFVDRAVAVIREPSPRTFLMLGAAVVVIFALLHLFQRKLFAQSDESAPP